MPLGGAARASRRDAQQKADCGRRSHSEVGAMAVELRIKEGDEAIAGYVAAQERVKAQAQVFWS